MRLRLTAIGITIILLLLVVSCSDATDIDDGVPTLMATSSVPGANGEGASQSPRDQAVPSDRVPATWTPRPTAAPIPSGPGSGVGGTQPASPEASGDTYEVVPGDTLAEIAERFGVNLDDLARLNGIENIDVIEVGQVLLIPR